MVKKQNRFRLTGLQKTILWVALLLCVVRFVQNPAVVEAILNFYAVGAVPGTDIVLSPDASLWLMVTLFSLGALAIFVTKVAPWRTTARMAAPYEAMDDTLPVTVAPQAAMPALMTPVHQPAAVPNPRPRRAQLTVWSRLAALVRPPALSVTAWLGRRALWAAGRWSKLWSFVVRGVRQLQVWAGVAWAWAVPLVLRGIALLAVVVQQLWRRLEPRIRAFDKRLETSLNTNPLSARLLHYGREATAFVQDSWRKAAERSAAFQNRSRE